MQKSQRLLFQELTTINLAQCEHPERSLQKLQRDCLAEQTRMSSALSSDAYKAFASTSSLNKPFLFVTNNDSKTFNKRWIDYIIEFSDKEDIKYEENKKAMYALVPEVNDAHDEIWFCLYLLLNPLIPLMFSVFSHVLSAIFKKYNIDYPSPYK
jgi:hypothetical protein